MVATVRVGVVGTGVMGAQHARLLAHEVPGATLAAIADPDADRARTLAAELGAAVVPDGTAMIGRADAVVVASADATHEPVVLPLLAAGVPVLCEKPLADTPDAARRIVDAERAAGRRLVTTGFMRRYDPGYVELRASLRDGGLGPALMMHCVHRNASGVGTGRHSITSSAAHEFDVVRWLLGQELVSVSAHAGRPASGAECDPLLLLLRTDRDVVITVEIFVNATYGYEVRCEVVAERGTVALDTPSPLVRRHAGRAERDVAGTWTSRFAEAYRRELTAWVRAVASGVPDPDAATAWDGYVSVLVAEAAVDALESGDIRTVGLPQG